jgi:hypothetical protein
MADPHQVISIMATAIFDVGKNHPDDRMDPEKAKQIAKCIVEALPAPDCRSCQLARTDGQQTQGLGVWPINLR